MSEDSVAFSSATHLMVPKGVSRDMTNRTPNTLLEHVEAQPVLQAESEFPVWKVEAQGGGRDDVQPVTGMANGGRKGQGFGASVWS